MGLRAFFGLTRDTDAVAAPAANAVRVQLSKEWLDAVEQALSTAIQDNPAKYSKTRLQDLGIEIQHIARGGDAAIGTPSLRGVASVEKQQQQAARKPVVYVGATGSADYGIEIASSITPDNVVSTIKQAARGLQKGDQVPAIAALQRIIGKLQ